MLLAWSAGGAGTWVSVHRRVTHLCHTSHACDSSCSLCRQESSSGRRLRSSTATGTNCATGLLFLLLAKVRCDSGALISLSASAAGYIPEGTARGQSGQPPAAEALVRSLVLCCPRCCAGSFQPKASLGSCCHLPSLADVPGLWQHMGNHSSPSSGNQGIKCIKVSLWAF